MVNCNEGTLVSYECHTKLPQTDWYIKTIIYFLTVWRLEV